MIKGKKFKIVGGQKHCEWVQCLMWSHSCRKLICTCTLMKLLDMKKNHTSPVGSIPHNSCFLSPLNTFELTDRPISSHSNICCFGENFVGVNYLHFRFHSHFPTPRRGELRSLSAHKSPLWPSPIVAHFEFRPFGKTANDRHNAHYSSIKVFNPNDIEK